MRYPSQNLLPTFGDMEVFEVKIDKFNQNLALVFALFLMVWLFSYKSVLFHLCEQSYLIFFEGFQDYELFSITNSFSHSNFDVLNPKGNIFYKFQFYLISKVLVNYFKFQD